MTITRIPEKRIPDRRLGRHINHDPQSRRYRPRKATEKRTVSWPRNLPALQQGDLGSCGGNGGVGVLATAPFVKTIPPTTVLNEELAVYVYSRATVLDEFEGQYQPEDTGTSAIGVCKALREMGLISGWVQAFTEDELHGAIQQGPLLIGSYWYEGMDETDSLGMIHVSGGVRGGHLWETDGFDLSTNRWTGWQSWGPEWGQGGKFSISNDDFLTLMRNYGDATLFIPLTQPAPVPTPDLTRITRSFNPADYDLLTTWSAARHYTTNKAAADAWKRGT